jgi:hypothetical protein
MAVQAPAGLAGIHLNFLRRPPPEVVAALLGRGGPARLASFDVKAHVPQAWDR